MSHSYNVLIPEVKQKSDDFPRKKKYIFLNSCKFVGSPNNLTYLINFTCKFNSVDNIMALPLIQCFIDPFFI